MTINWQNVFRPVEGLILSSLSVFHLQKANGWINTRRFAICLHKWLAIVSTLLTLEWRTTLARGTESLHQTHRLGESYFTLHAIGMPKASQKLTWLSNNFVQLTIIFSSYMETQLTKGLYLPPSSAVDVIESEPSECVSVWVCVSVKSGPFCKAKIISNSPSTTPVVFQV